ncbi:MAG: prephenate dehydrogenase/arogenate dehydrogenase family protein, partial [Anaerolineales bacterium]|nr:prephenate dehydrogenase/arogenate dehydrogenase family protein [Anaerolineales bacterium]
SKMQELLMAIAPDVQDHTVIMDTAVLKKPVYQWVRDYLKTGHYVSSMPIIAANQTHDTRQTIAAASADLFRNSTFCLFPGPEVDEQAVQTASTFGQLLGAQPFYVDITEYDVYMQALETLPALVSTAVFRALTQRTGWRDMARVAGLSFAQLTSLMTREEELATMALAEKQSTLLWIDTLVQELLEMRRWVQEGDEETLAALMRELGIQRDEWLHQREENDWSYTSDVQKRSMMAQMFGDLLSRGQKDDKRKRGS